MSTNEIQKLYEQHKRIALSPLPFDKWLQNYHANKNIIHVEKIKVKLETKEPTIKAKPKPVKKKRVNLTALAKEYGLKRAYFHTMKQTSNEKYKYILSFDSNPLASSKKYIIHVRTLQEEMRKILNEYKNKQLTFGRWMKDAGHSNTATVKAIYKYELSTATKELTDKECLSLQFRVVNKWMEIIKYHKEKR